MGFPRALAVVAALVAALAAPVRAPAQLDIARLAAGLAIPYVTRGTGVMTSAVITNAASDSRTLHFDLLNGDSEENWEIQSWQCTLTARESVRIDFVYELVPGPPGGSPWVGNTHVRFECDAIEGVIGPPYAGNDGDVFSDGQQGVLWVTVQNAAGQTLGENILFGDFTIIDPRVGAAASAPAAGFLGLAQNNGDNKYVFTPGDSFGGLPAEYDGFPAALATNFLPPATYPGQLLAFTLDGIPGLAPAVRARVLWFNDDEAVEDSAFDFKCMEFIDYADIAPGLAALDTAGHIEILPVVHPGVLSSPIDDVRRPLVCYNLQDSPGGGSLLRPCAQSTARFANPPGQPPPVLDTQL
jgi:hypothetical protein